MSRISSYTVTVFKGKIFLSVAFLCSVALSFFTYWWWFFVLSIGWFLMLFFAARALSRKVVHAHRERKIVSTVLFAFAVVGVAVSIGFSWIVVVGIGSFTGIPSPHFRTNIFTGSCSLNKSSDSLDFWYYRRGCNIPKDEKIALLANDRRFGFIVQRCEAYQAQEDRPAYLMWWDGVMCEDLLDYIASEDVSPQVVIETREVEFFSPGDQVRTPGTGYSLTIDTPYLVIGNQKIPLFDESKTLRVVDYEFSPSHESFYIVTGEIAQDAAVMLYLYDLNTRTMHNICRPNTCPYGFRSRESITISWGKNDTLQVEYDNQSLPPGASESGPVVGQEVLTSVSVITPWVIDVQSSPNVAPSTQEEQ